MIETPERPETGGLLPDGNNHLESPSILSPTSDTQLRCRRPVQQTRHTQVVLPRFEIVGFAGPRASFRQYQVPYRDLTNLDVNIRQTIGEVACGQWLALYHVLVRLWESFPVRP